MTSKNRTTEAEAKLKEKINQLEEQVTMLKNVIYTMPGNVYWKGLDEKYLGFNDNMAKAASVDSDAEFIGKTDYNLAKNATLISKEQADIFHQTFLKVINSKKEIQVVEEGFAPDGSIAYYDTRKVPLFDKEGKVSGMLGISLDITENVKAEKALAKAKHIAENSSKAKTEFIANMTHDIRTPFASIIGAAELLLQRESDTKQRELVATILNSSKGLLELLNQILNFSRLESNVEYYIDETFILSNFITSLRQLFSKTISDKQLDFEIKLDSKLPRQLIGNQVYLQRILSNLLSNAIKYTVKGKITLAIEVDRIFGNRVALNFHVIDTGIGIPEDKLDLIFEKFNKLSTSFDNDMLSNGLGLYIVDNLVNSLGGEISVKSELGKGSEFVVTIPFQLKTD